MVTTWYLVVKLSLQEVHEVLALRLVAGHGVLLLVCLGQVTPRHAALLYYWLVNLHCSGVVRHSLQVLVWNWQVVV